MTLQKILNVNNKYNYILYKKYNNKQEKKQKMHTNQNDQRTHTNYRY